MTTAFIVALLVGAVWLGFTVPTGNASALIAAAFGIVFFLAALLLYGTQCEGIRILDFLLFRAPVGGVECSGKFTFWLMQCSSAACRSSNARKTTENPDV
jgi:hypothetical protein